MTNTHETSGRKYNSYNSGLPDRMSILQMRPELLRSYARVLWNSLGVDEQIEYIYDVVSPNGDNDKDLQDAELNARILTEYVTANGDIRHQFHTAE